MEKYRTRTKKQLSFRLLKFFIFLFFICLTQNLFGQSYRNLRIKPVSSIGFTNTECEFVLEIPNMKSSRVRTTIQNLPEGIHLVSSQKEEILLNNQKSTRITYFFVFDKPGKYTIPPIPAFIGYYNYNIRFNSIEIIENPLTLKPQLKIETSDKNGKPIKITKKITNQQEIYLLVSLRYFKKVSEIVPVISENSLMSLQEMYEPLPLVQEEFSPQYIKLALFRWIPLVEGSISTGNILAFCEGWNGASFELESEMLDFSVVKTLKEKETQLEENSFFSAFDVIEDTVEKNDSYNPIEEGKTKIQKKYTNLLVLLVFFSLLVFSSLIIFIISLVKKHSVFKILLHFFFMLCYLIVLILFSVLFMESFGVAAGSQVRLVPQETSSITGSLREGDVVRIVYESEEWLQIVYNKELKGWVKKDEITLVPFENNATEKRK